MREVNKLHSNGENIKNVAVYTRVSTEDQARMGFSLESQLEKLKAYCFSRDWNIFKIYVDDGYSGRNINRPKYQEMFEEIDNWDAIVVIKMDRIHRNSMNFMKMMADLQSLDKNFVSMTESFDSSNAMGRFFMDMSQRIAQLESEQIGERTFSGMFQKAKNLNSGWMGHGIPFGYKGEREVTDEKYPSGKRKTKTILKENPDEIRLVKRGFKLAVEGKSITEISKILNLKWSKVHYFLHNPFYAGFEKWANQFKKTNVDPIISREHFNNVQVIISNRACRPNSRVTPLQLPLDDVDYFTLDKEESKRIHFMRFDKLKHPIGG